MFTDHEINFIYSELRTTDLIQSSRLTPGLKGGTCSIHKVLRISCFLTNGKSADFQDDARGACKDNERSQTVVMNV
jgi:hypothetical protein